MDLLLYFFNLFDTVEVCLYATTAVRRGSSWKYARGLDLLRCFIVSAERRLHFLTHCVTSNTTRTRNNLILHT